LVLNDPVPPNVNFETKYYKYHRLIGEKGHIDLMICEDITFDEALRILVSSYLRVNELSKELRHP